MQDRSPSLAPGGAEHPGEAAQAGVPAQVAILCNHQRAVPKGHTGQMQKMEAKLLEHQEQLDALQAELVASQKKRQYEGKNPRAPDM